MTTHHHPNAPFDSQKHRPDNFQNPLLNWVDSRLPVFSFLIKEYGVYPTPRNFNYLWSFGGMALFMLVVMIATGVVLAMQYTSNTAYAFDSVERITRDVNFGWLLRYMHANGASMFFVVVYIHMFRGMYYWSARRSPPGCGAASRWRTRRSTASSRCITCCHS